MNEIEMNERLVAAIAKQYENCGLTHEELIKAGAQGVDEAERYYPDFVNASPELVNGVF